jgi:hypothetical protein
MSTLKSSAEDLTLNADGSGNDVIIQSDGSTVVTVDGTNSRVGIGVASPSAKIDIADSSIAALLGSSSGTTRADATSKVARVGVVHYTNAQEPVGFLYGQSTASKNQIAIGGGTSSVNAATEINFWTAADQTTTTGTERMRIDSSGNVGIGTASPSVPLHINNSASSACRLYLQNTGNTSAGYTQVWSQNNDLVFTAGNAEKMRINSSGNVGIGVTPETDWYTDYHMIQLAEGAVVGGYGDNSTYLGSNWKDDAADKYINTDEASLYKQQAGKHEFKVAASGTADAAITWTTAMTIDNSGDVMVNRADTQGTSKLSITTANDGNGIGIRAVKDSNTNYYFMNFTANATSVGDIYSNGTTTTYATSSDYRLKENIVPMTGSIDRLKELNPSRFNFIADADTTVDGFLAHEAQEVVPEAISGTKDGMQTEEYTVSEALGEVFTPAVEEVTEERQVTETVETGSYVNLAGETITETQEVGVTEEATETVVERQDIDGVMTEVEIEKVTQEPVMETVVTTEAVAEVILETDVERPEEPTEGQWRETTAKVTAEREVPDMQGIDQGKLVPLLVGALQEAIARIETLENT